MRKLSKLFVGAATMAAAAALVAGTVTTASAAPNDPPKGITPQSFDVIGVGSNTTQYVMDQISVDYNRTVRVHNANHPWIFSWDAVKPGTTSTVPTKIVTKAGCPVIVRPNGSTAGLKALDQNQFDRKTGHYCIDFGRSSGGRSTTAPKPGPGGVLYVAFAKDAITWSTRTAARGGSNAPKSLTKAQLQGIFTCKTTNWKAVGGKAGAIKVYLPQPGSGTLSTWEKFMGITTLGSCVSQAPEENEGTFAGFNNPNAIFIYSIGAYVAQKFHSPACGARPRAGQNAFGCNTTGVLGINQISGKNPTTSTRVPVINPAFPAAFFRTVYNIVRWTAKTPDHIYQRLGAFFSSRRLHGFMCSSPIATRDIANYGFIPTPTCGSTS
jgi:ABC-type phosphate transport system substrate-binding protein